MDRRKNNHSSLRKKTEFSKQLKRLATVTPDDVQQHLRQKFGQLRIGDVVCLSFAEDIIKSEL